MKIILENIYNHKLFKGIAKQDLDILLNCLGYTIKEFEKQNTIFSEGQVIDELGIVITGNLHLTTYDFYGNRQIITDISEGQMFGESFSLGNEPLPFEISATEKSSIFFINTNKIITLCQKACSFHTCLVNNLISILALKNINLTQKIRHLSAKNVRKKILSYLYTLSKQKNSNYFDIPFNRQELADYLSVDRSNLSNELSKLKDSNLIEFEKNHFKIITKT